MRKLPHFAAVFAVAIFSCAMLIKGYISASNSAAPQPPTISVDDIQRSIDTSALSVTRSDNPF